MNKMVDMPTTMTGSSGLILGRWSVSRTILDRRNRERMVFEGIAVIDQTGFEEHGDMRLSGQSTQGRRTYQLSFSEEQVIVRFADGREFIRLDERPLQHVHHHCGSDTYRGRFFFLSHHAWGEVWHVTGPRKDYKSISRYTRL